MAKKNRGWVKLYRQIQDNSLWKKNEPFDCRSAWIDLLLMVNHEDRTIVVNQKPIIIHTGEHWTSYQTLADRWKWSRGKVIRYFKLLSRLGMCTTSGTTNGTKISLINYELFQDCGTTVGTTVGTADGISGGTADGTQTRTIEELKKNDKENARARVILSSGEGERQ